MSKADTVKKYTPALPPTNPEDMPVYMQSNLNSIANMVNSPVKNFPPLSKSPLKPREGDIAYADGIGWDPGDGRGMYFYGSSAWNLLGSA